MKPFESHILVCSVLVHDSLIVFGYMSMILTTNYVDFSVFFFNTNYVDFYVKMCIHDLTNNSVFYC